MVGRLGGTKRLALEAHSLCTQIENARDKFPVYTAVLFSLYQLIAQWFRKEMILPVVRAFLDEKLPKAHRELHNFLGRLAFYTEFPEHYAGRLGEILGTDPSRGFCGTVSTDDEIDGLVIADAVAYVVGMVERGQDPDGRFHRILDSMKRED